MRLEGWQQARLGQHRMCRHPSRRPHTTVCGLLRMRSANAAGEMCESHSPKGRVETSAHVTRLSSNEWLFADPGCVRQDLATIRALWRLHPCGTARRDRPAKITTAKKSKQRR